MIATVAIARISKAMIIHKIFFFNIFYLIYFYRNLQYVKHSFFSLYHKNIKKQVNLQIQKMYNNKIFVNTFSKARRIVQKTERDEILWIEKRRKTEEHILQYAVVR